jgi:hypothetical protein
MTKYKGQYKAKNTGSPRPFKTDYAGAFPGRCATRESAIIAATKHLVQDGYTRATITNLNNGHDIARLHLNAARTQAIIEVVTPFKKFNLRRVK